jgi:MFS family permease
MNNARDYSYLPSIFLGSSAFVFLNFSLPIRADDLGLSAVLIGGMYTVFTGTLLLVRPLVGYCLDRFGRRWFFSFSFLFYVAAMLVFSRSTDLVDFYLARFLQGIGASLMWVSARTMVADLHDSLSRGAQMGKLMTTSVRGSIMGAFFGFTLLSFLPFQSAWFWAFSGYTVAALCALIWSLTRLRETRPGDSMRRETQSRLIVHERAQGELKRILVVVFLSAFASALIEPIYLIFLKNKFDVSVLILAFTFLPAGLVYAVLPRYGGQWSDRWGRGRMIAVGTFSAGLVSIALPFWPTIWLIAASYIFFSVGWAMAGPAEDALVADLAPEHARGTILGIKEAAAGAGAALGPLAGGYVFEYWSSELTFVLNGGLLLATAILVVFWFGHGRAEQVREPLA